MFNDLLRNDGIRRGPFGSSLKKDIFVPDTKDSYAVYEQRNAINNSFKTRYFIDQSKYDELHNFHLHTNDIIMSGAGTIGKLAKVPTGFRKGVFNQALIRFRINDKVNVNYFLTFMNTPKMQRKLTEANPGSAMVNLVPMKELKKWQILIPQLEEQNKIEKLLTQVNKLLDLQQRKLEQLKQLKKAMLQQLFVDKKCKQPILRFKNFNGDWKQHKLRELGKIVTGNTPKTSRIENYNSNGIPWITPTDIHSTYTTNSSKHLSNIGKEKARVAPANSLLITCIASIGKNTLIFQESAFNQQINALIPHNNDSSFLLAESNKWSQIMTNLAGQTSMQIINKKDFSEIITEIPDLSEQKIIGSLFTKLNLFITLQQSKIDQLTILKNYLLQKLFI